MSGFDLPPATSGNFLQRVRDMLLGRDPAVRNIGDPLEKFVTRRELVSSGFTYNTNTGSFGGGAGSGGVGVGGSGSTTRDLTPPPTPSGLAVEGGLSYLYITHDEPTYSQGHGHDRTHVYGAKWPAEDPTPPTFSEAVKLTEFQGTIGTYPTEPATRWCIWITWESVDGVESAVPAGGLNGAQATTAQDVAALLEALNSAITQGQLHPSLGATIDQVATLQTQVDSLISTPEYDNATTYAVDAVVAYGGKLYRAIAATTGNLPTDPAYWVKIGDYDSLAGVVGGHSLQLADHDTRIGDTEDGLVAEASARSLLSARLNEGGDTYQAIVAAQSTATAAHELGEATASQVTTVASQASSATGIRTTRYWGFDSGADAWIPTNASIAASGGTLTFTTTAANPSLGKTFTVSERYQGGQNTRLRMRVRRVSGTGTWEGHCYYQTAAHTVDSAFRKAIAASGDPAAWNVLEWDMAALTAGGTDYTSNEIRGLRFDLVTDAGSVWELDWIAVGQPTTTPESAAIQQEASTRASETGQLFAQYTVKVDVNGYVSGYGLASTANNGAPTSEFGVRADRFFVASPTGPDITPIFPFVVQSTPTTVNGVPVDPGVYMDAAFIKRGTIQSFHLGNGTITDVKIVSVAAGKLTAGSIAVGSYIQSTGYVAGSAGWRINGNGSAEFSNVTIRGATYTGTIFANEGTIGGIQINATDIRSTSYVANTSGFLIQSNGNAFFNNAAVRGSISGGAFTSSFAWPTTGTGFHLGPSGLLLGRLNSGKWFRVDADGDVTAPKFSIVNGNAIFSGTLSAADGTFSGSLTADAVNAVDTLNLRGQAVTIPVGSYTAGDYDGDGTAQSVSLTSTGAPIRIDAGFLITTSGTSGSASWQIERERFGFTTVLLSVPLSTFEGIAATTMRYSVSTPPIIDTPGPGAVTYRLVVTNANTTMSRRGIFALELKR